MNPYEIFALGFCCGAVAVYLAGRLGRRSALREDEQFRQALDAAKKLRADVVAGQEQKVRDRERRDFHAMFV